MMIIQNNPFSINSNVYRLSKMKSPSKPKWYNKTINYFIRME